MRSSSQTPPTRYITRGVSWFKTVSLKSNHDDFDEYLNDGLYAVQLERDFPCLRSGFGVCEYIFRVPEVIITLALASDIRLMTVTPGDDPFL